MNEIMTWSLVLLAAIFAAGCARTKPQTPRAADTAGAATVIDSETVVVEGHLAYFSVSSAHGDFWTWSLNPRGPMRPVELDVRNCPEETRALENQMVLVTGKLVHRQPRHLNLVVVDQIMPVAAQTIAQLNN